MTDSIADRTHEAAVAQWEGAGSRGARPDRAAFSHLDASPDQVPETTAAPEPLPYYCDPAPLDEVAEATLADMKEQMRLLGVRPR